MKQSGKAFLLALTAGAVFAACGGGGEPDALRVGDVAYTGSELGALPGGKRNELGTLTAFGLAVARDSLGPVLRPFVEREEQSRLLRRLAAEVEAREAGIGEDELRRTYLQDPEYELTVRHLVVLAKPFEPEEAQRQARQKAEAALERIRGGEPFAEVAADVSEEPGADRSGGLLEPGRKGTWVDSFWDAASRLQVGEVSGVVHTLYGYHVLKLEDRQVVPFDSVRGRVLARVVGRLGRSDVAQEWAREQGAKVRVDASAVARWQRSRDTDPSAADSLTLATWPGGELTGSELRSYMLTLPGDARDRLATAGAEAMESVAAGVARNDMLADKAHEMGLSLDEEAEREIASAEADSAQTWATSLGFHAGQNAEQVKAAALRALAGTGQSIAIARAALDRIAAALRTVYPVEIAGAGDQEGGDE